MFLVSTYLYDLEDAGAGSESVVEFDEKGRSSGVVGRDLLGDGVVLRFVVFVDVGWVVGLLNEGRDDEAGGEEHFFLDEVFV